MPVIAVVALAGFLIGFGKSGVAGTLGPFVTVVMALALPADDAIGLLLPMLIVADAFTVTAHWRRWDSSILRPLLLTALAGIAAGSVVISIVDEPTLRRIIATAMLVFVLGYAGIRRLRLPPEKVPRYAWVAGSAAGLTSTLAHLGGPPIVAYLLSAGVAPRVFVGTSAALFAAINVLKLPGYAFAGLLDWHLVLGTAWAWLLIPVGVAAGRILVDRIDRTAFERVTVALLAAGSVVLLVT